jgi:uncharacterized protein (DUF427 family)
MRQRTDEGATMSDYPAVSTEVGRVEPVPRRVRAFLGGQTVFDTTRALYVWEIPYYPQFYIPLADVTPNVLVDEDNAEQRPHGTARRHAVRVKEVERPGAALVYPAQATGGLAGHVRFTWRDLDAWFEEDEQVFVHPRSPFVRVDALRSTRHIRISLDGVTLAESDSPVMVFETGLPTRYYLSPTDIDFTHLEQSDTVTECPYKGRTTGYWSARTGGTLHEDVAWGYDFPTIGLAPIARLIAFYNEKVDITLDGRELPRPGQ